jgi:hypothetical protein
VAACRTVTQGLLLRRPGLKKTPLAGLKTAAVNLGNMRKLRPHIFFRFPVPGSPFPPLLRDAHFGCEKFHERKWFCRMGTYVNFDPSKPLQKHVKSDQNRYKTKRNRGKTGTILSCLS